MKGLTHLIIACLVILLLASCCQSVKIKVNRPDCPVPAKLEKETWLGNDYKRTVEQVHKWEDYGACIDVYFKELEK